MFFLFFREKKRKNQRKETLSGGMSENQRVALSCSTPFFIWGGGCAGAGPLLPCYGYACRKSVQGGRYGHPARLPRDIAQLYRSGYDFLCAAVWAAGALDRSDHVPVVPRTRKSFHPHGNICPRAAVHAPFPVGAGASSGAAGSACATSVAGVKLPACAPFSGGAMLSACASVSVGAVASGGTAAVHAPRFMRRSR